MPSPSPSEREVIVLSPDLAGNAVGRALVFVDLLRGLRRVTIAGWSSGPVHPLVGSRDARIERIPSRIAPPAEMRRRLSAATVIATKPLPRSFGWALLWSQLTILDIDDPEIALAIADARTAVRAALGQSSPLAIGTLLALRGRAAAVTVSNRTLQTRYGGSVIPHARDGSLFNDELRDRGSARAELGLSADVHLVAFVGTARRHKGTHVLLDTARLLPHMDFAIVGEPRPMPSTANMRFVPPLGYRDALRWIAAADVIVVPQQRTRIGEAQSPAKLVDALAVGRAIIATRLPPVSETCGDAALLIDRADVGSLAAAIERVLGDRELRENLEQRGRLRFEQALSVRAVQPALLKLINDAENRR